MVRSASVPPLSVIVVDPHADNRAMYRALLEASGLQHSVVGTARDALARLRGQPRPHAVIFDVVLPDMTALAFCREMEALIGVGIQCRRIVCTGWPLSAAVRTALTRHGVSAICTKPCTPDLLLRALKR